MITVSLTNKEVELLMEKLPRDSSIWKKLWCLKINQIKENQNGLS